MRIGGALSSSAACVGRQARPDVGCRFAPRALYPMRQRARREASVKGGCVRRVCAGGVRGLVLLPCSAPSNRGPIYPAAAFYMVLLRSHNCIARCGGGVAAARGVCQMQEEQEDCGGMVICSSVRVLPLPPARCGSRSRVRAVALTRRNDVNVCPEGR